MKKNKNLQRINRRKNVSAGRRPTDAKPVKMKLKKGDKVQVMSGKDKGKTGVIESVFPKENKIVVEGIAIVKRHLRSTGRGQSGRIIERPAKINASNVMLLDADAKKPTRIGREVRDGKKVRVAKKSKAVVK